MAAVKVVIFDQRWKANISLAQEAALLKALKRKYNYQANIGNPAFDPLQPIDPVTNPQQISNPESAGDFIAKAILNEIVNAGQQVRLREVLQTKQEEATTQVNTEFSAITIDEEITP